MSCLRLIPAGLRRMTWSAWQSYHFRVMKAWFDIDMYIYILISLGQQNITQIRQAKTICSLVQPSHQSNRCLCCKYRQEDCLVVSYWIRRRVWFRQAAKTFKTRWGPLRWRCLVHENWSSQCKTIYCGMIGLSKSIQSLEFLSIVKFFAAHTNLIRLTLANHCCSGGGRALASIWSKGAPVPAKCYLAILHMQPLQGNTLSSF